ncbi:MAG: GntR family transcriptional regulator [Eubacteriales bacterium]|nr:GntR family transcriptional regulator [Eubacteriales bacterium]
MNFDTLSHNNYPPLVDSVILYIQQHDLTQNDRLPSERELCKELSVSRNTLRESLLFLVHHGYLTVKKSSGYLVRNDMTEQTVHVQQYRYNLMENLEILTVLEERLCLQMMKSDMFELADIRRSLEEFENARDTNQLFETYELSFHRALIGECKNTTLKDLTWDIACTIREKLHFSCAPEVAEKRKIHHLITIIPVYRKIYQALESKDKKALHHAFSDLYTTSEKLIAQNLTEEELSGL